MTEGVERPPATPPSSFTDVLGAGWQQPSTTRPVIVQVAIEVDASSTQEADVRLDYDIDGDGTREAFELVESPAGGGTGGSLFTIRLPPGGQYKIVNVNDPKGNNVGKTAEFTK